MLPETRKLFAGTPGETGECLFPVLEGSAFRLEHIVSNGAISPPGFWYDQDRPEWVALVQGEAVLDFEEGSVPLTAGDALLIPAGSKHRVARASADAAWIALHFTA